jgi:hypothetical protein
VARFNIVTSSFLSVFPRLLLISAVNAENSSAFSHHKEARIGFSQITDNQFSGAKNGSP